MSSNLPISSPYRSTPDAPVTDAERDRLNARLNAAYTAGTLDQDDYQARLDVLFAAKRLGELVPVVEGLPPLPTYCRNPDRCHLAGALDLAVNACPDQPPLWSVRGGRPNTSAERSEYRSRLPTTIWYGKPNLVPTPTMDL